MKHLRWLHISRQMEGRTPQAVHAQYYQGEYGNERRQSGDFTPEEEELLDELKERELTWDELAEEFAKKFPQRTLEELRLHYVQYLGGAGLRIRYSDAENEKLVDLKDNQRLSWNKIAEIMWWRTEGALKAHYYLTLYQGSFQTWSDEDLEQLRILREQGLTVNQIAQKLERTSKAVEGKLSVIGIHAQSRWTDKDKEKLRIMAEQGRSVEEIAQKLDRSFDAITRQLHTIKMGAQIRWSDKDKEQLRIMAEQGLSEEDIAQNLNRTVIGVRRMLRKMRNNIQETHEDRR